MTDPFYKTDEQYGNGIILEFYQDSYSLVRGYEGSDGNCYKKWGYPDIKKAPAEKAIPWKLELGDSKEAVKILKFFIRQLPGDDCDPETTTDEEIPF